MKPMWEKTQEDIERKRKFKSSCALQNKTMKKKSEELKYAKEIEKNKELAEKISSISCTVKVQAGDDDKLYGSVTTIDIQNALEQENITIDKKKIVIEEPIKKLGIYSIKIILLPEVETHLKVWVVRT